jgi:hypothetical protein
MPISSRILSRRLAAAALAGAALVTAGSAAPAVAQAGAGSLSYVRGGDVFLSAPDGSRATRLTRDGGYAWPSQADDGTIVAVRRTREGGRTPRRLHRLRRDGKRLGRPLETVRVDDANFVGPLAPALSPDGRVVAYHFFDNGISSDRPRPSVAYTRVDQGTEPGVFAGALGGYLTPSWLSDGRVLVFYGAERTSHAGIDTLGGEYTDWFGDPDVSPLLTDGEVTRAGDRLVAVGAAGDLRFYELATAPPGEPRFRCAMTGFRGDVSDPTWSPDGRSVAWEEGDGIHVARIADLASCGTVARPLVVPRGQDPDWGPAGAPRRVRTARP